MLTIRQAHFDALGRMMEDQFVVRMLRHLRERFGDCLDVKSDEEVSQLIRVAIRKAAGFDISRECDVYRFIEYIVMYGADFEQSSRYSWAEYILRASELSGAQKMDRIDDCDLFMSRQ